MCATVALFQQWDASLKVYIFSKFNAEWIWAKPKEKIKNNLIARIETIGTGIEKNC
jgi:hypothetical protein